MPDTFETMYDVETVANLFGVSIRTIYRYIEEGSLRAVQLKRAFRIPESSIKDYIQAHTTSGVFKPEPAPDSGILPPAVGE